MALPPGNHRLDPTSGTLLVRTYREGVAARVGHDLVIEVTDWEATVDVAATPAVVLRADPGSLVVLEGVGGAKPLTDRDRADIRATIEGRILRGAPIAFRSTSVRPREGGVEVAGELTIGTRTNPVRADLDVGPDGRVTGAVALAQTAWGIEPYRGLMGALKVRDAVEVAIDARLPA